MEEEQKYTQPFPEEQPLPEQPLQQEPVLEQPRENPQPPVQPQAQSWGQYVTQQTAQKPYQMTYADCPYETPYGNVYSQKPKREKKKKTPAPVVWILITVVVAILACLITAGVMSVLWEGRMASFTLAMNEKYNVLQNQLNSMGVTADSNIGTTNVPVAPGTLLTPGQVYAQNVSSVVAITANINQREGVYQSFGSGFIISADGYVVSNHHVVEGSDTITVTMSNGSVYDAALIGSEASNDICLLKVEAENLPHVTLGSSDALTVGDQVAAIGNPLGELTSTLTVGYVSAKDRVVATDGSTINMLQTDAAINSGNSGGPLFNMRGQVVGITTAKYSGNSNSGVSIEGIGFAIPIDDVIGMIEDLRDYGYITGAYLGVMVRDVNPAAYDYVPAGASVDSVTPGYAAERAGLKANDIIINLGGYDVASVADLTRVLRKFDPGQTVSITVYRNGQEVQLTITLDEKPEEQPATQETYPMPGSEGFDEWYENFMEDYFG